MCLLYAQAYIIPRMILGKLFTRCMQFFKCVTPTEILIEGNATRIIAKLFLP